MLLITDLVAFSRLISTVQIQIFPKGLFTLGSFSYMTTVRMLQIIVCVHAQLLPFLSCAAGHLMQSNSHNQNHLL